MAETHTGDSVDPEQHAADIERALGVLTDSKKWVLWATRLAKHIGAKALRPHVQTALSELEERVRAMLTWQSFDHGLHLVSFGSQADLKSYVSKPQELCSVRSASLVLGFSDQVPLWVRESGKKFLFAEHEVKPKHQSELRKVTAEHFCKGLLAAAPGAQEAPPHEDAFALGGSEASAAAERIERGRPSQKRHRPPACAAPRLPCSTP
jgi:hypothetical protein